MLEIKNLYVKYYNTDKVALKDISFTVKKGESVAILGPSGAGKTTLLNVISGIIKQGKEAEVKGSFSISGKTSRVSINMVFQDPTLLPWRTVFSNVSYGLEIKKIAPNDIKTKTKKAIATIGLQDYENYYPHQLSIGMQQRVNFARALVCNPDILLLDEPFSALDIKTKKRIQKEFLQILKDNQTTNIFVTHNPEEAFFMADRIIVLTKSPAIVKTIINNEDKKSPKDTANYLQLYEE